MEIRLQIVNSIFISIGYFTYSLMVKEENVVIFLWYNNYIDKEGLVIFALTLETNTFR